MFTSGLRATFTSRLVILRRTTYGHVFSHRRSRGKEVFLSNQGGVSRYITASGFGFFAFRVVANNCVIVQANCSLSYCFLFRLLFVCCFSVLGFRWRGDPARANEASCFIVSVCVRSSVLCVRAPTFALLGWGWWGWCMGLGQFVLSLYFWVHDGDGTFLRAADVG